MNILVVGKGGREHALAYAVSKSPLCTNLFVAPGNPGTAAFAQNVNIADDDISGICDLVKKENIDLTIIGPESSLAAGLADALIAQGSKVFGPDQKAARVESSKDFAKKLMQDYAIPTAAYATFDNFEDAKNYVLEKGAPIVIKEDGLKAGKGVTVALELEDALEALEIAFAIENNRVVIEEYLEGFEFSLIALTNGELVVPLECAQDHKRAFDDDKGPNTGGMGSYSPVRAITPELVSETMETIMKPMAKALVESGNSFTGFLYGGLMVTKEGIKVIEFNARFGDPEAEVILVRLESDFVQAILDVLEGKEPKLQWTNKTSHGVVLASKGYPGKIETPNAKIEIDSDYDGLLFHMGTKEDVQGLKTNGGRVIMPVTLGDTLEEAMAKTYADIEKIHCDALFYRHDIGNKDVKEND
jgi:phosphoribosylamine--glycine ligase